MENLMATLRAHAPLIVGVMETSRMVVIAAGAGDNLFSLVLVMLVLVSGQLQTGT